MQIYGTADKKVIQIKRQIVINLLKTEDRPNALKELFEIEVNFKFRKWKLVTMVKDRQTSPKHRK